MKNMMEKAFAFMEKHWTILVVSTLLVVMTIMVVVYKVTRRIEYVDDLPRNFRGMILKGVVTKVSDGDTLRFYHTPCFRSGNVHRNAKTLKIRLAGVDAPEMAHFDVAEQPMAREATHHLTSLVLKKKIEIKLLSKDRYSRLVCSVFLCKFLKKVNVSIEMVRVGLASVYRKGSAEYDGYKEKLEHLEAKAKKEKLGIWSLKSHVTPIKSRGIPKNG
jgi:endonuclease YncB( thermonuclease family)